MKEAEIVRRLRALLALPAKQRPISIDRLEHAAGVADNEVYEVARVGRMQKKTRRRRRNRVKQDHSAENAHALLMIRLRSRTYPASEFR